MSYYHTYRPQQFKELLGQDYIRQILQTAIESDRLVHAYLFCGSRGTGKTTTARLLAKTINCLTRSGESGDKNRPEPCNSCEHCLAISNGSCIDVIEIDAASNRGIEEIRQLQDQGRFRPQQVKKKIFIVDEVHMLTKEAFNALLKTLEEPPAHLLFILATTEAHKLPATILSRCQRFDFQTPSVETISQYLMVLCKAEKLTITPEAIAELAELARGSFRDSATLLEQLATDGQPITAALITAALGLPSHQLVDRYLVVLDGQSDSALLPDLTNYFQHGGNALAFVDSCFGALARAVGDSKFKGLANVLGRLVKIKQQLRQSPIAQLPVLVAVAIDEPIADPIPDTKLVVSDIVEPREAPVVAQTMAVVQVEIEVPKASKEASEKPPMVSVSVAQQVAPVELPPTALATTWNKLIQRLAADSESSMVAILRTARPLHWHDPVLKIGVQFKFHADQLGRQKNRAILETLLTQLLGAPVRIETELTPVDDLAKAAEELSF